MKPIKNNGIIKNILYSIGGVAGINFIIFIHEMGHFLFAKLFKVPALSFSLGFGPALYECTIDQTVFKLSLLPFGGYVELDPESLAALAYTPHILILCAGILFNLIFSYIVLMYYRIQLNSTAYIKEQPTKVTSEIQPLPHQKRYSVTTTIKTMGQAVSEFISDTRKQQNSLIGPIGIIAMIGKCLAVNPQLYWFILAILSLNIGLFNILPLPFFDGGKILILTIETLTGIIIPATIVWIFSTIILALFILFITRITINDIKQLLSK